MDYAVDMQSFKKPGNDFVLKELSFMSLNDDDVPIVHLFKPPFPWRRLTEKYKSENLGLELCYHGLSWDDGKWDYTEIGNILQDAFKDAKRIFVIDEIKTLWLERFNFKVTDITEMDYSSFDYPRSVTISTLLTKTSTIQIATKTSPFQRLSRRLARPIDSRRRLARSA